MKSLGTGLKLLFISAISLFAAYVSSIQFVFKPSYEIFIVVIDECINNNPLDIVGKNEEGIPIINELELASHLPNGVSYIYVRQLISDKLFSNPSPVVCTDNRVIRWSKEKSGITVKGGLFSDGNQTVVVFHPGEANTSDFSFFENGYFIDEELWKVHKRFDDMRSITGKDHYGYGEILEIWPISGAEAPDSRMYRCTLNRYKSSRYFRPFSCAGLW